MEILFSKCKRARVCMWVRVGVCARLQRGQHKQRLRASSRYGTISKVDQTDITFFRRLELQAKGGFPEPPSRHLRVWPEQLERPLPLCSFDNTHGRKQFPTHKTEQPDQQDQ